MSEDRARKNLDDAQASKMADKKREAAEKATQAYAALGIGLVCIVIGVPLWWKTTTVYRVTLPYAEIAELATSKVKYTVDFSVVLLDSSISDVDGIKLSDRLKETLQYIESHERLTVSYRGNIRGAREEEKTMYAAAKTIQDLDNSLQKLPNTVTYKIYLLPEGCKLLSNSGTPNSGARRGWVGRHGTAYVRADPGLGAGTYEAVLAVLRGVFVNEAAVKSAFLLAEGAQHKQGGTNQADKDSMRSVRSHAGYQLTFTLLNPQPDILNVTWDIVDAIDKYLAPLQTALKDYVDLPAKSQYLHYTGLGVQPEKQGDMYVLTPERLPHIITPIEAYLGSHVSTDPNLNFLVYIPTRDQSPLHILSPSSSSSSDPTPTPVPNNAFLSPRWGGVQVYNAPTPRENASLPHPVPLDMRGVMETAVSQLRLLLGVATTQGDGVLWIEQPGNDAITRWEVLCWLRCRCVENIASATTTLHSLAQLLEQISNIVIQDHIGSEVESAVAAIRQSQTMLSQGKLQEAFFASQKALAASETAFFDQSLLELLYFPEDQKFAIYIPLFLPISIPVVLSTVQAVKWMMGKEKQKTE